MLLLKSWPFIQAKLIINSLRGKSPVKKYILFETGYAPSGIPHIGTLGEVIMISMVRKAFIKITNFKTKIYCIADDMDAFNSFPNNIPTKYGKYNNISLFFIPDPFYNFFNYTSYINNKFIKLINNFNFRYTFINSSFYYKNGVFNHFLKKIIYMYNKITDLIINTLSNDRQNTYSIFLPICSTTGEIIQIKILSICTKRFTITYISKKKKQNTSILNGRCKLQWKVDFPMRWAAFNVNYEMYGKDISANSFLYNKIYKLISIDNIPCQTLYELFLDENSKKISKSKGNGITIDVWSKYIDISTLKYYIYVTPKKSKKISLEIIPRVFDNYLQHDIQYDSLLYNIYKYNNPIFFVRIGKRIFGVNNFSYSLILNLINACNSNNIYILYKYILKYFPELHKVSKVFIMQILKYTISYYNNYLKIKKINKTLCKINKLLLRNLFCSIKKVDNCIKMIHILIYYLINNIYINDIKSGFISLYEIILDSNKGPQIASFMKFYGIKKIVMIIRSKL